MGNDDPFIAGGFEAVMAARLGTTTEACECLLRTETKSTEHEISNFFSLYLLPGVYV